MNDLLPNFLNYLRSEWETAWRNEETILLCFFCHGKEVSLGLEIGGSDDEGPLLTMTTIYEIISPYKGLQICLLLTSFYSEGWTIILDLRDHDEKSKMAAMIAAGPELESK